MKFPKFEAIRRSLVRLIEPADTSAPPDLDIDGVTAALKKLDIRPGMDPHQIETMIRDSVKGFGPEPRVEVIGYPGLGPDRLDMMPWAEWSDYAKRMTHAAPGWTFCRFAHRSRDQKAMEVMGIVRGDFGIWQTMFPVCVEHADQMLLSTLTHLPSGGNICLFLTDDHARTAAEIASVLRDVNWKALDPNDRTTWKDVTDRLQSAWNLAGLHIAPFHAHHPETGTEMSILMHTSASQAEGRPEKLS